MTALLQTRELRLPAGAWYGDRTLSLPVPPNWELDVREPRTPEPLTEAEISAALERPVNQPPVRRLAEGRRRPVIVVDDLTRPTPAAPVLRALLDQLQQAGIGPAEVTVVLAKGAHGPVPAGTWERKIGPEAAAACRLCEHQYDRDLVRLGRTSFGTPVLVNRVVAASDLVIGVGGVYPQYSTGFGGGSKLALGVLGRRSIMALHYGHPSMEGSSRVDNDFRRDLDEIAARIGLRTMASVHVDAHRRIVRLVCGDHFAYYPDAVRFARRAYAAPLPGGADVVVANAYPIDISLTFMRSKGLSPLHRAANRASRVAVSSNSEGVGLHRLYPFLGGPSGEAWRQVYRHLRFGSRKELAGKVRSRLRRPAPSRPARRPIHLFSDRGIPAGLPARCRLNAVSGDELVFAGSWAEVVRSVEDEQAGRGALRVAVYPCASIQVLEEGQAGAEAPA